MTYMIYGSKDNERGNLEVFYIGEDAAKAKGIYKKLVRLNDLKFPETEVLKKEHNKLLEELREEGISLFEYDEYITAEPIDWDISGFIEFKNVR